LFKLAPPPAGGKGGGGGAPLLGTLEDMLRKYPDIVISFHRGPFTTKGTLNWERGGGLIYWVLLKDE